mmetsp:Transcript_20983/g.45948  ORF Transcript_20983/g.45948 Transcript_20983/m.45948 type:complete len:212 (+) Transcript_20983:973-1608(+)
MLQDVDIPAPRDLPGSCYTWLDTTFWVVLLRGMGPSYTMPCSYEREGSDQRVATRNSSKLNMPGNWLRVAATLAVKPLSDRNLLIFHRSLLRNQNRKAGGRECFTGWGPPGGCCLLNTSHNSSGVSSSPATSKDLPDQVEGSASTDPATRPRSRAASSCSFLLPGILNGNDPLLMMGGRVYFFQNSSINMATCREVSGTPEAVKMSSTRCF